MEIFFQDIRVLMIILLLVVMLTFATREISYQKIKLNLEGSRSEKLSSIEKILKSRWYEFRFFWDMKRKKIKFKREIVYEDLISLVDIYKNNQSEKNLKEVQEIIINYFD